MIYLSKKNQNSFIFILSTLGLGLNDSMKEFRKPCSTVFPNSAGSVKPGAHRKAQFFYRSWRQMATILKHHHSLSPHPLCEITSLSRLIYFPFGEMLKFRRTVLYSPHPWQNKHASIRRIL